MVGGTSRKKGYPAGGSLNAALLGAGVDGSTAGGSSVPRFVNLPANWDSRPQGAFDGQWAYYAPTDIVLRWLASAAAWVRPEVYAGTPTLDFWIVGTENSVADLQGAAIGTALTVNVAAAVTVSTAAGWCLITAAGDLGFNSFEAYATPAAQPNGDWCAGYMRMDSVDLNPVAAVGLFLYDALNNGAGIGQPNGVSAWDAMNAAGGAPIPETIISAQNPADNTNPFWVEQILVNNCLYVYVGHAASPTLTVDMSDTGAQAGYARRLNLQVIASGVGTATQIALKEMKGGSF